MVMALDPSYLAQADRHVAKLKALISDQEALIELLSADDQPTQLAETLIGTMKDTLHLFEEHRQSMLTQIEDLPRLESSTRGCRDPTNGHEPHISVGHQSRDLSSGREPPSG
jgi:hypothetical protein